MTPEPETSVAIVPEPGKVPALGKAPTMLEKMQPQTFDELIKFAGIVARANWAPASYKVGQKFDEDKILIAMMQGMELGLPALMSVQSIAVINGMPSIYGDAMLAVVERSGLLEDFRETPLMKDGKVVGYETYAKRKGRPTPIQTKFDWADAKRANLIGKAGPWTQYEGRMFQFRSRSLCLRDGFSDVLKGLTSVEEAQDVTIVSNTPVPNAGALTGPGKKVGSRLDAFAGTAKTETEAEFEDVKHDDTTGEIGTLPEEVQTAYAEAKYGVFLQWLAAELDGTLPTERQAVADEQMHRLTKVRASSPRAEATVDKLAGDFGITLKLSEG